MGIIPMAFVFLFTSSLAFAQQEAQKAQTKKSLPDEAIQDTSTSEPAQPSSSSGELKHAVGLGLGQTFLMGDFHDNADDSITADFFYNYSASYSFDLLGNFHFWNFENGRKEVTLMGLDFGIKSKFYQFDNFAPFVVAGLGFYQPYATRDINGTYYATDKKIVFGSHFGLGGDLRLNDIVSVGILGQYHNPFDIKQDVGGTLEGSYFKLMFTVFYYFL